MIIETIKTNTLKQISVTKVIEFSHRENTKQDKYNAVSSQLYLSARTSVWGLQHKEHKKSTCQAVDGKS